MSNKSSSKTVSNKLASKLQRRPSAGFICECKYCNLRTFKKHESYVNEFVMLRDKLSNCLDNHCQIIKNKNLLQLIERIIYIFNKYYDANAYYLNDYCKTGLDCGLIKKDFKYILKYAPAVAYWGNLTDGYIVDNGDKQSEYKFLMPATLEEHDWTKIDPTGRVQKMIQFVIATNGRSYIQC
eukprot:320122_1